MLHQKRRGLPTLIPLVARRRRDKRSSCGRSESGATSSGPGPGVIRPSAGTWAILRCSYCGGQLGETHTGGDCPGCGATYPYTESGAIDLRPQRVKRHELSFEVGSPPPAVEKLTFAPLDLASHPEVDFTGLAIPHHLTPELMSHIPRASSSDSLALDLGCGTGIHRAVCERAGFAWVGIDYDKPGAPMFGDAHALPFADEVFEFIFSVAVLEHIQYPPVMLREAHRVLKPGGKLIGTVSFLEPFHESSYYHHTHLGTVSALEYGGFDVEAVAPSRDWPVLRAQAEMGLFPEMPGPLARLIVAPVQALHRLWWRLASLVSERATEPVRVRNTTGSFTFIVSKPAG